MRDGLSLERLGLETQTLEFPPPRDHWKPHPGMTAEEERRPGRTERGPRAEKGRGADTQSGRSNIPEVRGAFVCFAPG